MNYYGCNKCKKRFSRKWHALRHNESIHHGLAIIFNHQLGPIFKNHSNSDTLSSQDPFRLETEAEQKVLDVFGKIIDSFEELEKLVSHWPELQRIKFLSDIVITALMSPNPVKLLHDAIDFNRSLYGKAKIVNYVARSSIVNPIQADVYLTELIKSSPYYKKYINFNNSIY